MSPIVIELHQPFVRRGWMRSDLPSTVSKCVIRALSKAFLPLEGLCLGIEGAASLLLEGDY